jgi:hypothetical protein
MLPSLLPDDRGAVALLFALTLPLAVGAVGAAVDYADLSRKRTDLQRASDAAALAGAKAMMASAAAPEAREAAGREAAAKVLDGLAPKVGRTIEPSLAAQTVAVRLAGSKPLFLGGFLGTGQVEIGTHSEATYSGQPGPCIVALGDGPSGGISLIGSAQMTAPKCSIHSNRTGPRSIYTQGAARIVGAEICGAGAVSANASPKPQSDCPTVEDPLDGTEVKCGRGQNLACTVYEVAERITGKLKKATATVVSTYTGPCDYKDVNLRDKGPVVLLPGVYCGGLRVQGSQVTLSPGFYQIQDGPLALQSGATSVAGTGVSILLSGNGAVLDL